jgi:hypothetical protein
LSSTIVAEEEVHHLLLETFCPASVAQLRFETNLRSGNGLTGASILLILPALFIHRYI